MASSPDPYDFSDLLHASRSELRAELTRTVAELATTFERIAFIQATAPKSDEKYEYTGTRDALNEKKWLILKLMDDAG
jgi:hypothetical protein